MTSRHLPRTFAVLALCALPALAQSPGWQPRPGKPLATGPGPSTLAIADLNGDAHPDLLTGHQRLQKVAAWLGDGRGGFVDAQGRGILLTYEPGAFAAADLNGDALADVVVASSNDAGEHIQVFLNEGRGGFWSRRTPMIQLFPTDPYYKPLLHFADLNEDGKQDLLAGNGRREDIQILLGDGRGGLVKSSTLELHQMPGRYFLAVGDVDGDRHVDIVSAVGFADNRPSQVTVHLGDGAAHFRKGPTIEVDAASEGMRLIMADMDADALPDLVLSHGRTLTVLRNAGSALFMRMASPVRLPTDVFAPQAADLDGDGRLDIAVATVDSVSVLLNRPEGFRPAPGSPFPAGPGSYNVSLADLDHDGHTDVLTSSYEGNSVGLLFGR